MRRHEARRDLRDRHPVARTYPREANAALAALASGASGIAEVLAKPDPSSAAWRSSLNGKLDALAQVDAQARALKPGAEDAEVHQRLLEITGDFNRVAQLLRSSVEPVNPDGLTEAAQLLSAGVTRVAALRLTLPQSSLRRPKVAPPGRIARRARSAGVEVWKGFP